MSAKWYWFDPVNKSWIVASDSGGIESRYQLSLKRERTGSMFFVFEYGKCAIIDYDDETISCGSRRCMRCQGNPNEPPDYTMNYCLKRE